MATAPLSALAPSTLAARAPRRSPARLRRVEVARLRAIAHAPGLTEVVRAAIRRAGAATVHGCREVPPRFSEIISAQSALGGWSPSPRKFTEARRRIEAVRRMPAS